MDWVKQTIQPEVNVPKSFSRVFTLVGGRVRCLHRAISCEFTTIHRSKLMNKFAFMANRLRLQDQQLAKTSYVIHHPCEENILPLAV